MSLASLALLPAVIALAGTILHAEAGMAPLGEATVLTNATTALRLINGTDELVQYLNNPATVCTALPTNHGMKQGLSAVGPYVGMLVQNESTMAAMLTYPIVPDKLITPEMLKDGAVLISRFQQEKINVQRIKGQAMLYSVPESNVTVITQKPWKIFRSLVYLIDGIIVPQPLVPQIMGYVHRVEAEAAAGTPNDTTNSSSLVTGGVDLPSAPKAADGKSGVESALLPNWMGVLVALSLAVVVA